MSRNEAQTRFELIDPALFKLGWTTENIKVEETVGGIDIIDGKARRRRGRTDYLLRLRISNDTQPVAVALIEAKAEDKTPGYGLNQGKRDGDCTRLNVKFVFSTNGHQFVEYDKFTGITSDARPMSEFPTPEELRKRYEEGMGFNLESELAKPLLTKYSGGEAQRRYYQDAAIRAVFERIAQGKKRALLSLATGAGKTFIAVNMLKRIADAGQLEKALFICDRDELRTQALSAFQGVFGSNAAAVEGKNAQKNARVIIATYQSLGINGDDTDSGFLLENYPENYFSHIVIDECHRSAWGKWSQVLTRNENAVQIGLTATPRSLILKEESTEAAADLKITADNIKYFGEPVYEYGMLQAVEDGYLAACEIQSGTVDLDNTGITMEEVLKHNPRNAITGEPISEAELKALYEKSDFESKLLLPDRIMAMCADLFSHLIKNGGPEQKTIIFGVRDAHAELIAAEMNNLYSNWCNINGHKRCNNYAFKCTAESKGSEYIADMKGSTKDYFVATTVDLLSTGVDIPAVRNIVFFRYMKSPISFYQMVGRGTRLSDNKLMFTIYDYTNATRLFGEDFVTKPKVSHSGSGGGGEQPVLIRADGIEAEVTETGRYVVTEIDGKVQRVTIEEYKAGIAKNIVNDIHNLSEFRELWVDPSSRRALINNLLYSGYSPEIIRQVECMTDFDLYDVLVDIAYGVEPKTREERAFSFSYKQKNWLSNFPAQTQTVIIAIANQFAKEGTEAFENNFIFDTKEVKLAGGIKALKQGGNAAELIKETKIRLFAA